MTPTWIDHALVLCFTVLLPLRGATLGYRRLAALADNDGHARMRFYRQSLALHGLAIALTAGTWLALDRPWAEIGLAVPDPGRLLVGLAAAFAGAALHYWQGAAAQRGRRNHALQRERLGRLNPLMPRTRRELDLFVVLLLVAAFGEELLYRGFLTAYLATFVPFTAAAVLSVVVFAIGHLYQGAKGVAQTLAIGALCMAFYLLTGSLWPGIVLHGALNFVSAHIGHAIVRATPRA
jgi:CAAX protease family protein